MDFAPSGFTYRLDYTDNANASVNIAIQPCDAVQVLSTQDVVLNFGTENSTASMFPYANATSGAGVIVQGDWLTTLPLPGFASNKTGTFYVSASSTANGTVYISTGALL